MKVSSRRNYGRALAVCKWPLNEMREVYNAEVCVRQLAYFISGTGLVR